MPLPRTTTALLTMSALNLALMVPGGFVETRTFAGYSVSVLAAFNVFLTGLGIGSLILAFRILRTGRSGLAAPAAGLAYVAVYGLDLLRIFPIATTPMSMTLATMEWGGTALGAATVLAGVLSIAGKTDTRAPEKRLPRWVVILIAAMALAIVTFATLSAK